jgi:hypothetical protein
MKINYLTKAYSIIYTLNIKIGYKTLALEAETAISHINIMEQDHMRYLETENLKLLIKNHTHNTKKKIQMENIEKH